MSRSQLVTILVLLAATALVLTNHMDTDAWLGLVGGGVLLDTPLRPTRTAP